MSAPKAAGCRCEACVPMGNPFDGTAVNVRMILCATCGNKRCPHATNHHNACTNSNDPGQAGSSYELCSKFVQAIKPSPAPVQPDMGNHISENIAAALLTAHGVCPHSTGTPAWAQWLTDAVAPVQPQAEPVAAADKLDAERYRWLRSTTQRIVNRHGDKVDVTPEIMDSTIDDNILAAMKGTP